MEGQYNTAEDKDTKLDKIFAGFIFGIKSVLFLIIIGVLIIIGLAICKWAFGFVF